jgi:hypothetical protein
VLSVPTWTDRPRIGWLDASRAMTSSTACDLPSHMMWSGVADTWSDNPSSEGPVRPGAFCLSSPQPPSATTAAVARIRFINTSAPQHLRRKQSFAHAALTSGRPSRRS